VTQQIYLEPFTLVETQAFLKHRKIRLSQKQMMELYWVMGGMPYYLQQIKEGLSVSQIIDELAFKKKSFLLEEFQQLFDEGSVEVDILRCLAASRYGVAQAELIKKVGRLSQGGSAKNTLAALEDSGFIMRFKPYGFAKRGQYYRLTDEYTLFYLTWIEPVRASLCKNPLKRGYWEDRCKHADKTWVGLAFESVCYKHLLQISDALHLPVSALADSWRYVPRSRSQEEGAQIDLLFDRDDEVITVCEIKYHSQPFVIDKQYAQSLQRKVNVFSKMTNTNKTIMLTFITVNGVKETKCSEELIDGVVTLKDLFL
jgi:uncharacterized protein